MMAAAYYVDYDVGKNKSHHDSFNKMLTKFTDTFDMQEIFVVINGFLLIRIAGCCGGS